MDKPRKFSYKKCQEKIRQIEEAVANQIQARCLVLCTVILDLSWNIKKVEKSCREKKLRAVICQFK